VFGELGARLFNVAVLDPDASRGIDNMPGVHELARARNFELVAEFFKLAGPVATLKDAAALATSGQFPGLKIMVDSLHLARGGETPADVAAIDPGLIGAMQICDGQLAFPGMDA